MDDSKIPFYSDKDVNMIYSIQKQLGKGSFGTVFLAIKNIDTLNPAGKQLVMKFIDKTKVSSINILNEYELKNALKEKCRRNLVCYRDLFQTDKAFVITMDYIKGFDLYELLVINKTKISQEEKLKITSDLIRAIKTIHESGLVHRDIKHENVVYDAEAKNASLIDYGFICNLGKIPNEIKPCHAYEKVGTVAMLEPEMLKNFERKNTPNDMWKKSDLFSLGLIIYTIWTGDLITGQQAVENPGYVFQKTKNVPSEIRKLIFRLLIDPKLRISSENLTPDYPFIILN